MAEDDGLSFAPVFVIDVDVSSVFFSYSYVWHDVFSFLSWVISVGLFLSKLAMFVDYRRFAIARSRDFVLPRMR